MTSAVEIADYFSVRIRRGDMSCGDALPPVRQLASELKVNPNTVASAYARLRDAGLITTGGRRGSRVAEAPSTFDIGAGAIEGLFDLSQGNIDPQLIPPLERLAQLQLPTMTGYDQSSNVPQLMAVAGQWLHEQGITDTMETPLAVFSGALDAMERALRAHTLPGDRIAVEDPCWPPVLKLLNFLKLKAVPLAMDADGCSLPDDGTKTIKAAILTPRAQNPTGFCMTQQRAQQWTDWFSRHPDCLLIVDDFWGPLAQCRFPPLVNPAAQVYVLSLSKFLGPDLRCAICCGSPVLLAEMQRQQLLSARWVSHILQHIAAGLWHQLNQSNQLQQASQIYQQRRRQILQHLPARIRAQQKHSEGVHIWLTVESEAQAVQAMAARGWAIQAGEAFRINSQSAVRISLANVGEQHQPQLSRDILQMLGVGMSVVN